MTEVIIYSIATISLLGIISAIILNITASKFKVYEDPRIDEVEAVLPAANCGGCGYAGCRNFAEACVQSESLDNLKCPVGGNDTMSAIGKILGIETTLGTPLVAVVRCNGTPEHRAKLNSYDGAANCTIEAALYRGETACQYGCLGHGECVDACDFGAMYMDPLTKLPIVIDSKCTACGACVKACPRNIIELRKKNNKDRKIYVSCINEDKGVIAKNTCKVACIGCTKCEKVCNFNAITIRNFLAFIDSEKCTLCRKCVSECPTNSILEFNFPPRKIKPETTSETKTDNIN